MYAYTMNMSFGTKIRQLREAKNLSLRDFAKKLGDISPAHISDIELGKRFPSEQLLEKIALLLDIAIDELQEYDSRPPIDEIRKLVQADSAYGFALRKLVSSRVTPDDILELLEKKQTGDQ